jgi:hypothetical protein
MSDSLIDLTRRQLKDPLPGIVSTLIGESMARTRTALDGAVPALLDGLAGALARDEAALDRLTAAIGEQDDGLLHGLGERLGSGHRAWLDQGRDMLRSLLGAGALDRMAGELGRFAGIGDGSAKALLGLLAPIVIAVLGSVQRSQGLDGPGLAALLKAQRAAFATELPPGLAAASDVGAPVATSAAVRPSLSATPPDGMASGGAGPPSAPADWRLADAGRDAPPLARPTRSRLAWRSWAALLLVLAALVWLAIRFLADPAMLPSEARPDGIPANPDDSGRPATVPLTVPAQ